MEILIVGSIIVALMVWASTRIKRDAAAAYDEELIEGDGFTLTKPAGFIHMLNDDSGLAFRANSKDFGLGDAAEKYQATITVERHDGKDPDAIAAAIKESASGAADEEKFVEQDRKNIRIDVSVVEDGVNIRRYVRLVGTDAATFELRADVLDDVAESYSEKIENLFASFEVK